MKDYFDLSPGIFTQQATAQSVADRSGNAIRPVFVALQEEEEEEVLNHHSPQG
jgi:hypothetical protein